MRVNISGNFQRCLFPARAESGLGEEVGLAHWRRHPLSDDPALPKGPKSVSRGNRPSTAYRAPPAVAQAAAAAATADTVSTDSADTDDAQFSSAGGNDERAAFIIGIRFAAAHHWPGGRGQRRRLVFVVGDDSDDGGGAAADEEHRGGRLLPEDEGGAREEGGGAAGGARQAGRARPPLGSGAGQ